MCQNVTSAREGPTHHEAHCNLVITLVIRALIQLSLIERCIPLNNDDVILQSSNILLTT